jgi:hypothetical protein
LLKLTSGTTTTITPKKRGMANILDAVLKSTETSTLASAEASEKKIEDVREVAAPSASSTHVKAGPSGATLLELVKECLPENPHLLFPKHDPRVT